MDVRNKCQGKRRERERERRNSRNKETQKARKLPSQGSPHSLHPLPGRLEQAQGLRMEGLKVGTKQWAGGCLDAGNGDTVGSEGGAGTGELEFGAMILEVKGR